MFTPRFERASDRQPSSQTRCHRGPSQLGLNPSLSAPAHRSWSPEDVRGRVLQIFNIFLTFLFSSGSLIIRHSQLKRHLCVESLEPTVDCPRLEPYHSASSVCVTPFLYTMAAKIRCVGFFPSTLSRAFCVLQFLSDNFVEILHYLQRESLCKRF